MTGRKREIMKSKKQQALRHNNKGFIRLTGSSRDRRKQFRALKKQYPEASVHALISTKRLSNGEIIQCEDANVVPSIVHLHQ